MSSAMPSRLLLICCVIYSVIWPSLCYTQRCGPNERPVECIDRCQRCEYINGGCAQPAVCTPGCDCIPGYFRNKQNQCVPAAFCPGNFPCLQEVDPGPCKGSFPRFYYNKRTGQCEKFIYGGCKGNSNNFFNKEQCELICKDVRPAPSQQCSPFEYPVECIDRCQRCEYKNGNCTQPKICTPGCNCVPGFLRDSKNKCIPADFCPGNFPCSQEVDPGPCLGYFPRFYYNKRTGQCEQFIYGGCKGNSNNFFTKKECELMCKGNFPCSQEVDPGPCDGYFPRFYFNKRTGQCEKFIYGGCEGNANNFFNKESCELICKGKGPGPSQQCPAFEYPVGCIDRCQRCEYKNGNCAQAAVCTPGCNCVPGFLRDRTNKCIPRSHCP